MPFAGKTRFRLYLPSRTTAGIIGIHFHFAARPPQICSGTTGGVSEALSSNQGDPGSCKNPVCREAHLELAGVLLERGQFER